MSRTQWTKAEMKKMKGTKPAKFNMMPAIHAVVDLNNPDRCQSMTLAPMTEEERSKIRKPVLKCIRVSDHEGQHVFETKDGKLMSIPNKKEMPKKPITIKFGWDRKDLLK